MLNKGYSELNSTEREMYDELLLAAHNNGDYYPHDPKGAIDDAFRVYIENETRRMREDFREMRWALLEELREGWAE